MALPSLDNKNESDPTLLEIKKIDVENLSFNIEQSKYLLNINESMSKMYELAKSEADEARRQRGFELELLRESARKSNEIEPPGKSDSSSKDSSSWIDMLGTAILVAVAAYALGVDKYIRAVLLPQTLKTISRIFNFKKLFAPVGKLIAAPFKTATFTKAFAPVSTAWKNFTAGFQNVGKTMGAIKAPIAISEFKTTTGKIGASIGKVLKPVIEFFKTAKAFFAGGISKVGDFFKGIGSFFTRIAGFLPGGGRLLTLLKGVPVLGQVIAVVMGIFDFITGFIDGFKKKGDDDERSTLERIWDGTKEGIIKAIKGILTIPLDLITKGVAWIAGKLGFDQVEAKMTAWLDGGGFTGMFDDLIATVSGAVDWIWDGLKNAFEWFKLLFTDPKAALISLAKNYLSMLTDFGGWIYTKAIEPIVNWIGTLFGAKEGETSKSITAAWSTKLDKIINFATAIYEKYIEPIVKWVSDLFGGGDKKGGKGGIKWPDLSGMMPDLPTWDNIKGRIGHLLNNMIQSLAGMMDSIYVVPGAVVRGISDLGTDIAGGLGVTSAQKYSSDSESMETVGLDAETGRVLTKKELDARTKAAEDAKAAESKAAGATNIQVNKGGDNVQGGPRANIGMAPKASDQPVVPGS